MIYCYSDSVDAVNYIRVAFACSDGKNTRSAPIWGGTRFERVGDFLKN